MACRKCGGNPVAAPPARTYDQPRGALLAERQRRFAAREAAARAAESDPKEQ